MRRIGIDVGGTNTDAVLLEDGRVVHAVKTPTTADVTGGIVSVLDLLLQHPQVTQGRIDGVVKHWNMAIWPQYLIRRIIAVQNGGGASAQTFIPRGVEHFKQPGLGPAIILQRFVKFEVFMRDVGDDSHVEGAPAHALQF